MNLSVILECLSGSIAAAGIISLAVLGIAGLLLIAMRR